MKKRWLSVLMCFCLLLSTVCFPVGQVVGEEAEDPGYILHELDFKITGTKIIGADGKIAELSIKFDPIDFTALGADYENGKLGLQMDVYTAGCYDAVTRKYGGHGQIEFTSSNDRDRQEHSTGVDVINWKEGEWVRQVISLSKFGRPVDDPEVFDPTAVNYHRMYFFGAEQHSGEKVVFKICNVRLVDMDETPPSLEDDPIGDGSFVADPPEWEKIETPDGYNDDDVVVAGYNLGDYLAPNTDQDATPIIQSLLDGLAYAGGGTLYIPAGEYKCEGELIIPNCVTMYGDWQSPDVNPKANGTILKVYSGKGNSSGAAFIDLSSNCQIQNLTIWYPEQSFEEVIPYPPTCRGGSHYQLKNITFVNPYMILKQGPGMSGCPNLTNIYGSPLFVGIDMDGVADIGRLDEIHFSPEYWINSGLAGAPKTDEEKEELREELYYMAVGIILRRIDWSYLSFTDINGYGTGLMFDMSHCYECFEKNERWKYDFPNGHCYGLNIENCQTGLYIVGTSEWGYGEMVTSSVIKDCEVGVLLGDHEEADGGNVQFSDVTISASDTAVYQQGLVKLNIMDSVIEKGPIVADNGVMQITNTKFLTEGPHVVLENGACAAVLVGNTDANGKPIQYTNESLCPVSFDSTKVDMDKVPTLSAEEAAAQIHKPAREVVYVANDLDGTGATDMTAKIQAWLDKAKNEGGGVVFLPPGAYRLNGSITVPSGVELKGSCDVARIPYNAGSTLAVYGGKGEPEGTPTVILEANSGIRGITFDYPEQYPHNYPDLYAPSVEKAFVKYPYAMQGRGENIYIINMSIRNGYNGLDLMSYACDNHYVEYLAGICMNNSIRVGGGSKGGYIRNYQFNYGAYHKGAEVGNGSWANSPTPPNDETYEKFLYYMKRQLQWNATVLQIGNVEDQLLFDNFSYAGHKCVQLIEEDGEAANAQIYGQGTDYAAIAIDVEAAENVDFINLQVVSFEGDEGIRSKNDLYDVWLHEGFEGEIDIYNMNTWQSPDATLNVEGGTLNMYGGNLSAGSGNNIALLGEKGKLNLNASLMSWGGSQVYVKDGKNTKNMNVNAALVVGDYTDADQLNSCKNVMKRITRWDAPSNAKYDPSAKMLFTEGFTGYASSTSQSFVLQTSGQDATVTAASGMLDMYLNSNASTVGIENSQFVMDGGREDSLYYVETRLNVESHRACDFSQIMVMLKSGNTPVYVATLNNNGELLVEEEVIGEYSLDTWYRLAVEIDMRDATNKTYRVILMDDDYKVLATSSPIAFSKRLQDAKVVFNAFSIIATADTKASADTATKMKIDYVFSTYSKNGFNADNAVVLGDVDNDGEITSTDARLVLQYVAGKIEESDLKNFDGANVDTDSDITSTDARLILQLVAGKITEFPIA